MLTKIILENFRCFKEKTEIDFKKTNYKTLEKSNVYDGILKGGIFVGANGSGKTSVILGIKRLLELLFDNTDIYQLFSTDYCAFAVSPIIKLGYEFKIDTNIIKYYISYNIEEESLNEKLECNNELLINRLGNKAESKITEVTDYNDLDSNNLLIREIYFNTKFRGYDVLKKWFEFLINSVFFDAYDKEIVSGIRNKLNLSHYINDKGISDINNFLINYGFDQQIDFSDEGKGEYTSFLEDKKKVFFIRNNLNQPIPYELESLGNKNLITLLPILFHSINNGGMLLIDEFSSGFHNKLEYLLVKYFMESSKNSQLFLVSHSTNLLSNSLLRPDQEYGVTFDGKSGSHIYRFSENQPRESQNVEKMYLGGVFGAIPMYDYDEIK